MVFPPTLIGGHETPDDQMVAAGETQFALDIDVLVFILDWHKLFPFIEFILHRSISLNPNRPKTIRFIAGMPDVQINRGFLFVIPICIFLCPFGKLNRYSKILKFFRSPTAEIDSLQSWALLDAKHVY